MEINKENLPKHIAIIMDGNRRWAREHGMLIKQGHKEGVNTLEKIVRYAKNIGIKHITVYAFSTENWNRSKEEVSALMILLQSYIDDYARRADTENIRINFIGDREKLSKRMQKGMDKCIERTKNNTGIIFNIALNYGGRLELVKAVKEIAKEIKDGKMDLEDINEDAISNRLYTAGQPDPDLVIRTSGEMRLSNFLPWQVVYSEFLFVEKKWPDFSESDLDEAIIEYQRRTRNFGAN